MGKYAFDAETIIANLPPDTDTFVEPAVVAKLIGVSEKWLAAAREGRKNFQGPPFVKLGNSKTSPVRYKLSSLQVWMASLQERNTTAEIISSPSYEAYKKTTIGNGNPWLYAISEDGSRAENIFSVLANPGVIARAKYRWLTLDEFNRKLFNTVTLQVSSETLQHLRKLSAENLSNALDDLTRNLS